MVQKTRNARLIDPQLTAVWSTWSGINPSASHVTCFPIKWLPGPLTAAPFLPAMIITDNTPQSPVKDSAPLLGGASGSGAPPPAYSAARDAGPTPIGAAGAPYPVYPTVYAQPRESAARRFCMAFLVAFGIWILASALLGSILDNTVSLALKRSESVYV